MSYEICVTFINPKKTTLKDCNLYRCFPNVYSLPHYEDFLCIVNVGYSRKICG